MAQRRWWPLAAAAALAALAVGVAGCGGRGGSLPIGSEPEGQARLEQQARDALDRWDAAVEAAGGQQAFVPVNGAMTAMVGEWEEAVGGNHKAALAAGQLVVAGSITTAGPGSAEIRWADGTTQTVRTITAAQAVERIRAEGTGGCDGCTPLQVVDARFTTAQVQTSRGVATAPAWEFTLSGTSVRVTHVAVAASDRITVTPPPWDPYNSPGGLGIERATVSADGLHLMVHFTGSPGTADEPCGADYTAVAVESDHAVVVIVTERRHAVNEACTAIGAPRTAPVELAKPLGARAVLEVQQGLPVSVTRQA